MPQLIYARQPDSRQGFTLMELLLVLVIISVIGALAAPRLDDFFERQRLRNAAADLRLKWEEARLEAMKTGQAQVFNCQLSSGDYTLKPLVLQSDISDMAAGATMQVGGQIVETQAPSGLASAAAAQPTTAPAEPQSFDAQLEEGLTFVACVVATDMRSYQLAQESSTAGLGDITQQNVAQQVVFYPDGSTSTAEVRLQNKRGDVRAVRMRGLTGHATVQVISLQASSSDDKQRSKTAGSK